MGIVGRWDWMEEREVLNGCKRLVKLCRMRGIVGGVSAPVNDSEIGDFARIHEFRHSRSWWRRPARPMIDRVGAILQPWCCDLCRFSCGARAVDDREGVP